MKVGRGEGLQSYELGFPNFYARAVQFSKKWRKWILFLYIHSKFLVLINGAPCGFFENYRGLCQGDPLYLLFVIVMEVVSKMMDKVVREGRLFGFSVGASTDDHL